MGHVKVKWDAKIIWIISIIESKILVYHINNKNSNNNTICQLSIERMKLCALLFKL